MSLLMDALKKAEEAKRRAVENPPDASSPSPPELELLPLAPPAPSSADLAASIDPAKTEPSARKRTARDPESATSQPAPATRAQQEQENQTAIRNVFSAKQVPQTPPLLWAGLGLAVVTALATCGYFWWQLHSVNSSPTRLKPAAPTPVAAPAAPGQPGGTPARVSDAAKLAAELRAQQSPMAPATLLAPTPPAALFEPAARQAKAGTMAAPTAAESPVRLSRSQPKTNTPLEQAYQALQTGSLEEARRGYEQVLRADSRNIDALLGMATLAVRQGQSERAQAYYLQALEVDPKDATAQAGLINTRGPGNVARSESQLKTALDSHPDSAPLHFALGNLYASQNRWSEAQQAYFHAYSTSPENPDFMFNLAVSLDHLHQKKLAIQYYQLAQKAAATSRSISFDPNQVSNRLQELQP